MDSDGTTVRIYIDGTIPLYLSPGTYSSEVTFHVCTEPTCAKGEVNGSPLTIPVSYRIAGLAPDIRKNTTINRYDSLHFGIGQTPADSDWSRTFRVGSSYAESWTATSSVDWLTIDPTSASGGPVTVTATLVAEAVAELANGTHTGTISFSDGTNSFTLPVDLTINRSFGISEWLPNGDFDSAMEGWSFYSLGGQIVSSSTTDGIFSATPTAVSGANSGNVFLTPARTFALTAGHHYRVSFDAWADAPRKLGVIVRGGDSYTTRDFVLDTTPAPFDVDAVLDASNSQAYLRFYFGGSPTPVHVDNVSFHEVP